MSEIVSKTITELMTSPLVPSNYVSLCFRVRVRLLTIFSVLRGIKLKFGGGVSSEALISYFMSFLPKMNLMKILEFYSHFL